MENSLEAAFSLAGRVAVVTGAASGIGRETAHVLAEAGAATVVSDIDEAGLAETADLIAATGVPVSACPADVACRAEVDGLADRSRREHGRIDVWVNVAGVLLRRPVLEASEEDVDRVLAVNLKGAYWGCAAAGRVMRDAGSGSIVNISSAGGESAVPGLSIYSMSKAGLNMLTRSFARELGAHGIRVNAVAPGWVDTPMGTQGFRDDTGAIDPLLRDAGVRQRAQASPLGLTGTPRDVALAVLYLASDASRFTTGQILRPNGGVAMP